MDPCQKPRAGFVNAGISGWVTASIQMLFHTDKFVNLLMPKKLPSNNLTNILRNLCKSHSEEVIVDPQPLLSELRKWSPKQGCDDLAAWFISFLIENLQVDSGNVSPLFSGMIYVFEKCQICGSINGEQSHQNVMYPIHVDINNSVQEGIDEYTCKEVSDQMCCNAKKLIYQEIKSPPEVLILKINKGDGTYSSDAPFNIDLEVKFGEGLYRLLGALLKSSIFTYKVLCSNGMSWLLYNDTNVKKISAHFFTVSNQNFREELSLLFYERRNDPNKCSVDSPVKIIPRVSPLKLQDLIDVQPLEEANLEIRQSENKKWVPTVPDDLTSHLAAADHVSLDIYDPFLTEDDVEGAVLPNSDVSKVPLKDLKRWLQCRGDKTSGSRPELEERIRLRFATHTSHVIDPEPPMRMDGGAWHSAADRSSGVNGLRTEGGTQAAPVE